jgi:hypothetical protein
MMHIISLGAGVQSSTMALMAARGEITPMPDCAIFADTGAEPQEVYDHLHYLTPLLPFPVHVVSGGNLEADFYAALSDSKGRCGQPPLMVFNHAKGLGGRLWRQCTKEYKLSPIRRKLRELCGGKQARQLIGISLDEAHRMKPSGVGYIENIYPLVDLRMSRNDCLAWMAKHGYRKPPKSACYFCPYIDDNRLRDMRDRLPAEWDRLVKFDAKIRELQGAVVNGAKITGTLYVHRSCKPIEDVDLRTAEDAGQIDMFGNECEGLCGV